MSNKLTRNLLILILIVSIFIRVYDLSGSVPSLYWDEMDVGYQAYSILKTGKDYFGNFPFLTIHSFADFRAPLLIYATMPFVAIFGLNPLGVRLPAALFGLLSIFLIYLLTQKLFDKRTALITAALVAFAPWNVQYSRMAFEATIMLSLFLAGLTSFFKGLSNSKWFIICSIFFSLSLFTYNTVKLFAPIVVLLLGLIYIRKKVFGKHLYISLLILTFSFLIGIYSSTFLSGGQRFSEIAVFTDPQIASEVNNSRQLSALSYKGAAQTGQEVRFIDELIYNKITFILDRTARNYLKVFSADFLFLTGDPNLRHSTSIVGEFYRIEALTILLGLAFLLLGLKKSKNNLFLLVWILIAPLPAILTREGGSHATRLFFLFPALSMVSALGLIYIWEIFPKKVRMPAVLGIAVIWIFNITAFLNFYFGAYKLVSAQAFQYGFDQAIAKALEHKNTYEYVIIDDRNDSALMNYLFNTALNPALFQSQVRGLRFEIAKSEGQKIDNIIMMRPGARDWEIIFKQNRIDKNYLLIVSAVQLNEQTQEKVSAKLTANQKFLDVIYYKTGNPAFYIIESKKSQ